MSGDVTFLVAVGAVIAGLIAVGFGAIALRRARAVASTARSSVSPVMRRSGSRNFVKPLELLRRT